LRWQSLVVDAPKSSADRVQMRMHPFYSRGPNYGAGSHVRERLVLEPASRSVERPVTRVSPHLASELQKLGGAKLARCYNCGTCTAICPVRKLGSELQETPTGETVSYRETPREVLEEGYQRIRDELVNDLLDRVKECSPEFFERLVVELLVKMGYGGSQADAGRAIGKSGDGGIDGMIKEDKLGLDAIYIQAKRWEGTVGRPEIQKFVGAMQGSTQNPPSGGKRIVLSILVYRYTLPLRAKVPTRYFTCCLLTW